MQQGLDWVKQVPGLEPRPLDAHKCSFGRVLIVAGSRGMAGAACLAGVGALRGGAGLVRVACPRGVWPTVASYEPSYLTWPLPEDERGMVSTAAWSELEPLLAQNDVVAVGPGLGQSGSVAELVGRTLAAFGGRRVVDADGLNAVAGRPDLLQRLAGAIVSPHPGELARLTGKSTRAIQAARVEAAVEFARQWRTITVLKGHRTVVTDGGQVYLNDTGNPGMATGGSGDVLTGLVAAFAAQGLGQFEAACLAVRVHGLAGDLAAAELGQTALIASDLLRFLPAALRTVES